MTREEAIRCLSVYSSTNGSGLCTDEQHYEAKQIAIKALEQEPCEDEYIKVPKKALKYRTAGMVAYNAEWLKNHFDIERAVICGAQESCEDAVSRQAVIETIFVQGSVEKLEIDFAKLLLLQRAIKALPSVIPQEPKTGHWIEEFNDLEGEVRFTCSSCGKYQLFGTDYCYNCGAKMIEPQESEDKE